RDYIEKRIPHLSSRLVSSVDELIQHAEVLLLTRDNDALMERAAKLGKRPLFIDLRGRSPQSKKMFNSSLVRNQSAAPNGRVVKRATHSNGGFKRLGKTNGKPAKTLAATV